MRFPAASARRAREAHSRSRPTPHARYPEYRDPPATTRADSPTQPGATTEPAVVTPNPHPSATPATFDLPVNEDLVLTRAEEKEEEKRKERVREERREEGKEKKKDEREEREREAKEKREKENIEEGRERMIREGEKRMEAEKERKQKEEEEERERIRERLRRAAEERVEREKRKEKEQEERVAAPVLRRPRAPAPIAIVAPNPTGERKRPEPVTSAAPPGRASPPLAWDSGAEEEEEEVPTIEVVDDENWDDDPPARVAGFREAREYPMLRHTDGSRRRRYNPNRQLTIDDYEPRYLSPRRNPSPPPQLVDRRPLPPVPVVDRRDLHEIKHTGVMFNGLVRIPTDPFVDPPPRTCLNCWRPGHPRRQCPEPEYQFFCLNCGRRDTRLNDCPRCGPVHRQWLTEQYGSDAPRNTHSRPPTGPRPSTSGTRNRVNNVPPPQQAQASTGRGRQSRSRTRREDGGAQALPALMAAPIPPPTSTPPPLMAEPVARPPQATIPPPPLRRPNAAETTTTTEVSVSRTTRVTEVTRPALTPTTRSQIVEESRLLMLSIANLPPETQDAIMRRFWDLPSSQH